MTIKLFELCGRDQSRVFSPFCWRTRMSLAHKGLAFESVPWRFTDKAAIAFAGTDRVPVLVDGDTVVVDSWAIAQHLDRAHPGPGLLRGAIEPYRFIQAWGDTIMLPAIGRLVVADIPALLDEADRAYFVASREARYGRTLAEVVAGRETRVADFRASLLPIRHCLRAGPFLGGDAPDYADFIVFGGFMWARVVSGFELLAEDDPVAAWRARLLDLCGGMARTVPAAA
jgi:glutathione S-transferase